jgi:hypothetical protein
LGNDKSLFKVALKNNMYKNNEEKKVDNDFLDTGEFNSPSNRAA